MEDNETRILTMRDLKSLLSRHEAVQKCELRVNRLMAVISGLERSLESSLDITITIGDKFSSGKLYEDYVYKSDDLMSRFKFDLINGLINVLNDAVIEANAVIEKHKIPD